MGAVIQIAVAVFLASCVSLYAQSNVLRTSTGVLERDTGGACRMLPQSIWSNCVYGLASGTNYSTSVYYDIGPGRNNGTQETANQRPTWVTNGYGAYSFDGSDDNIMLSNACSFAGLSSGTVCCWYRHGANPAANAALIYEATSEAGYSRFAAFVLTDGSTLAAYRDTNAGSSYTASGSSMSAGTWYHVGMTVNANTDAMYLYINGVAVGTNTTAKGAMTTNAPNGHCVGALYSDVTHVYSVNGIIDEAYKFNRDLSASEMSNLYNATKRGHP